MKIEKAKNKDLPEKKYKVGDLFITTGNYVYFVRIEKVYDDGEVHTEYCHIGNEHNPDKWSSFGSEIGKNYIPIESFQEAYDTYKDVMDNPDKYELAREPNAETTELTVASSSTKLEGLKSQHLAMVRKINIAKAMLEQELEAKKWALRVKVEGFMKEVDKLQKIIDAINMYLGIDTDIKQLKEGAPVSGPIYLRQMVLYMDEEFGDPRKLDSGQKGIDWQTVEDFDKWIVDKGLERVLPEPKGIVAIKASRQNRHYSDSPLMQMLMSKENEYTYFLIRNGDNLYRLFTSIIVRERLYPTVNEMEKVVKEILSESYNHERDMERIADAEYPYKRNALIIQGLIDRTDIFKPLPECNILKPETYEGGFVFIRDDEMLLGDSKLSWHEWKNKINASINVGSRVLIVEDCGEVRGKRFLIEYTRDRWGSAEPPDPATGIYKVEGTVTVKHRGYYRHGKPVDETEELFIKYNPGDEVGVSSWQWDPHPRKNKLTWIIYKNDDFLFNFDQLSLEDVEFYLNDRQARKDILTFIYGLWHLRDFLLEEKEKEKEFIKLIAGRNGLEIEEVQQYVDWWKFKNKWKRSLNSDDAKALRMIEKKIQSDRKEHK